MAIDKCFVAPPTTSLVDERSKTFFPLSIPWAHWQLRHFLSNPASATPPLSSRDREAEEETLYYASGKEVYCLNTRSRKRKHVATLPFSARCTASGYGWVCIGGECNGKFAALKVDAPPSFADVDDRIQSLSANMQNRRAGLRQDVKVDHVGEDIVNSISIHRLTCPTSHLEDIVAVLTNNDKTVRVYSLSLGLETCVNHLEFAMNHATISPCGTMLVAVGDEPQAFFFRREMQRDPPQIPKPHNRLNSDSVEWRLTNTFDLHVTTGESSAEHHPRGYFTTAWSPNSKLCAVGSESGHITVFDTDLLSSSEPGSDTSQHAIVAIASGSRPDLPVPHPGAIRSMLFSPQPFDLLFWNEDQGRMCVGDLRTGLQKRQIVNLEPSDTPHKGEYTDVEDEECREGPLFGTEAGSTDLPQPESPWTSGGRGSRRAAAGIDDDIFRFGNASSSGARDFANQYVAAHDRANLRRQRNQQEGSLSTRERQVLDSLRTSRQREENRAAASGNSVPRVNYTTPDLFSSDIETRTHYNTYDTTTSNLLRRARASLARQYGLSSSAMDAHLEMPVTDDFDEAMTDPDADAPDDVAAWRQIDHILAAQRRSDAATTSANNTESSSRRSPASVSTTRELSRQYSRLPPSTTPPSYASADRAWLLSRVQQRNGAAGVSGVVSAAAQAVRDLGPRMTGLALSHDGRTVFAACEDGIFEVKVNCFERMFWDAVELR